MLNGLIKAENALNELVSTIEATGGVVVTGRGVEPVGDRGWSDLGSAYLAACDALGRAPVYNVDPRAGLDDGF
jgi:hypothetical protein